MLLDFGPLFAFPFVRCLAVNALSLAIIFADSDLSQAHTRRSTVLSQSRSVALGRSFGLRRSPPTRIVFLVGPWPVNGPPPPLRVHISQSPRCPFLGSVAGCAAEPCAHFPHSSSRGFFRRRSPIFGRVPQAELTPHVCPDSLLLRPQPLSAGVSEAIASLFFFHHPLPCRIKCLEHESRYSTFAAVHVGYNVYHLFFRTFLYGLNTQI